MVKSKKLCFIVFVCISIGLVAGFSPVSAFEPLKGDMDSYDPNNPAVPSGDTIKIGLFEAFSGPGALGGQVYGCSLGWVAHDINTQGGILVDGKKKLIEIVKGDNQVKPAIAKKIAERLCLEDKVDIMAGSSASHICLIGQQVASKYKKIYLNFPAFSESLMDARNFNRYTFRGHWTTNMMGAALAYYYSARPERKFYLLNEDYSYGHNFSKSFKENLKKYRPEAEIVGDTFHPLYLKDFAPYLTKFSGTDAEVLVTADWPPDSVNLVKQMRALGNMKPVAGIYVDYIAGIAAVGGEGGKGIVNAFHHIPCFKSPANDRFNALWNAQSQKWKAPYDNPTYTWPIAGVGGSAIQFYWLFDVVQRAGSTDPEKIIATWEGDTYTTVTGQVRHMRTCDHQAIMDLYVTQLDYPSGWYDDINAAGFTQAFVVPARFCTPPVPEGLDRCNK